MSFTRTCQEECQAGNDEGRERVERFDADEEKEGDFGDAGQEFGVVARLLEEVRSGRHDAGGQGDGGAGEPGGELGAEVLGGAFVGGERGGVFEGEVA